MKAFRFFSTFGTLLVAGGAAALAAQIYRRPRETMVSVARAGMLLAGAREGTCDVGDFPIHYYCAGRSGEPIILIHGLGGTVEGWVSLLPRFSKKDTVYALDLPGFGSMLLAPEIMDICTNVLYVARFTDALCYP